MTKDRAAQAANNETGTLDSVTSNTDTVVVTVKANSIQNHAKPLTATEVKRLAECEAIFKKSKKEFMKGWDALMCISEEGLYRATHSTFEQYCREKWGITARYANRLMLADAVVENIKSEQLVSLEPTAVPENEAQARPLAALTPTQQIEAARIVGKTTGKHTAKDFESAADKVAGKKAKAGKPEIASGNSDEEDPRGKGNASSITDTNTSKPNSDKSGNVKGAGDLEKLLEMVDAAQTQARKTSGCEDVAKSLGDLAKTITRMLNGGGK